MRKLTQREKYIAMGVGVTVAVVVVYQLATGLYFDPVADITKQTNAAIITQKENTALFEKQTRLKTVWTEITSKLLADDSAAESQALNAALDWAQSAGVNISAVKPERTTMTTDFEVIAFHLEGTGSTPAMGRLLLSFETAAIPVRVDQMTLTPVKEGTDNLKIVLDLSTLCVKPADTAAKTTLSDARGISEVHPWSE